MIEMMLKMAMLLHLFLSQFAIATFYLMDLPMTRTSAWFLMISLLAATMLACNLPLAEPPPPLAPPTAEPATSGAGVEDEEAGTAEAQPYDDVYAEATATPEPTAVPTEAGPTNTPLPTFTPILAPTATTRPNNQPPTAIPTEAGESEIDPSENAVVAGDPTPTLRPEFQPLALTFVQTWAFDEDDRNFSWATVTLTATGGDGNYTYFRDNKPQKNNQFGYRWRSCVDNLGTFRVDSADGQTVTVEFKDKSPCP